MTGPRVGSRPWRLQNLKPGERTFFEVPANGSSASFQSQIAVDITRSGLNGVVSQRLLLAVDPRTREVIELVAVTRTTE